MGKRKTLTCTSGKRELNPADAYRRKQRLQEKKRNKIERDRAREETNLKKDPKTLHEDLLKLRKLELLGKIDEKGLKRKAQLETLWGSIREKIKVAYAGALRDQKDEAADSNEQGSSLDHFIRVEGQDESDSSSGSSAEDEEAMPNTAPIWTTGVPGSRPPLMAPPPTIRQIPLLHHNLAPNVPTANRPPFTRPTLPTGDMSAGPPGGSTPASAAYMHQMLSLFHPGYLGPPQPHVLPPQLLPPPPQPSPVDPAPLVGPPPTLSSNAPSCSGETGVSSLEPLATSDRSEIGATPPIDNSLSTESTPVRMPAIPPAFATGANGVMPPFAVPPAHPPFLFTPDCTAGPLGPLFPPTHPSVSMPLRPPNSFRMLPQSFHANDSAATIPRPMQCAPFINLPSDPLVGPSSESIENQSITAYPPAPPQSTGARSKPDTPSRDGALLFVPTQLRKSNKSSTPMPTAKMGALGSAGGIAPPVRCGVNQVSALSTGVDRILRQGAVWPTTKTSSPSAFNSDGNCEGKSGVTNSGSNVASLGPTPPQFKTQQEIDEAFNAFLAEVDAKPD